MFPLFPLFIKSVLLAIVLASASLLLAVLSMPRSSVDACIQDASFIGKTSAVKVTKCDGGTIVLTGSDAHRFIFRGELPKKAS